MFNLDSALGIEIVGDSLVFAVVKRGRQGYSVQGSMVLNHYADMPESELYGRVQHFVNMHSFNRDNVILGIPREHIILRYITLPREVEENLEQVAQLQFRKYEPNEEVESCLDYSVVERNETTGRIKLRVSMVSKDRIDTYINLLGSWDLYPYSIRVSSTGLAYAFAVHKDGFPEKNPVLIFKFDERLAEATLLMEGQEFVSETFHLKPDQEADADWLMIETTSLISRMNFRIDRISRVYMAGDYPESLFAEMQSRLGDVAPFTEGFNPVAINLKPADLQGRISAVGLALSGLEKSGRKRMNLIPADKRLIGGTPSLAVTAVLAFLVLVVGIGLITQGYFQERILLNEVETQIQRLQQDVDGVFRLREDLEVKQAEVEMLRELMSDRQAALLILKDLSERVPEDSYFRTFKISGDSVDIQGTGSRAAGLVPIIADSPYLEAVKTNWIRADSRDAGKERFSFTAQIKGSGEAEE